MLFYETDKAQHSELNLNNNEHYHRDIQVGIRNVLNKWAYYYHTLPLTAQGLINEGHVCYLSIRKVLSVMSKRSM